MGDGLGRAAGSLLLKLLEQPEPVLSKTTIENYFSVAGRDLIAAGLLRPYGSDLVDVSGDAADDRPVAVQASPHEDGLGYFSEIAGWTRVPAESLTRYKIDIPSAITAITERLAWPAAFRPAALLGDCIWDLGAARLLRRDPLVPVWFVRRIREPEIQKAVADQVKRRPAQALRVILVSTPLEPIRDCSLPGHLLVSIHDVVAQGAGIAVDPTILAALVGGGRAIPTSDALYLSPDGRLLIIRGEEISFKSDIHIAIVRLLMEGRASGRRYTTEELLKKGRSNSGALHRAFGGKWDLLRPHLVREDGGWRFNL
jgi:hypothetical protein